MNGIIVDGKVLRLVKMKNNVKTVCFHCALSMATCGALCMHFAQSLGYTKAASESMCFQE